MGLNRWPLALYPRRWRERYGAEVVELSHELVRAGETTRLRASIDLVRGAVVEWGRVLPWPLIAGAATAMVAGRIRPRPYFAAHRVGLLLVVAESVWLVMELAEWRRGRGARRSGVEQHRFRRAVAACVVVATLGDYAAPGLVPGAQMRPGGVAFAVGLMALAVGIGLRGWSFMALRGRYFNFTVGAGPALAGAGGGVVTAGPYGLVRHPGHAGMLLICAGFGLASANWAGLAAMTLVPLAVIVPRIRAEEASLLASAGDRYRSYALKHKRLVPLVW